MIKCNFPLRMPSHSSWNGCASGAYLITPLIWRKKWLLLLEMIKNINTLKCKIQFQLMLSQIVITTECCVSPSKIFQTRGGCEDVFSLQQQEYELSSYQLNTKKNKKKKQVRKGVAYYKKQMSHCCCLGISLIHTSCRKETWITPIFTMSRARCLTLNCPVWLQNNKHKRIVLHLTQNTFHYKHLDK